MILDLLPKTDSIFKDIIPKTDINTLELETIHNLVETMIQNDGFGISANQCGIKERILILTGSPVLCCINPIIVDMSLDHILLEETCLTHPNMILKVKRPRRIKVRYTQFNGEVITTTFDDLTARVFQRQLDILDGILFTKKASIPHLEQAKNKKRKVKNVV